MTPKVAAKNVRLSVTLTLLRVSTQLSEQYVKMTVHCLQASSLTVTNFTIRNTNFTIRNTKFTIRSTYFASCTTNFTIRKTNFTIRNTNFTIRNTNFTIRKTNFTMHGLAPMGEYDRCPYRDHGNHCTYRKCLQIYQHYSQNS